MKKIRLISFLLIVFSISVLHAENINVDNEKTTQITQIESTPVEKEKSIILENNNTEIITNTNITKEIENKEKLQNELETKKEEEIKKSELKKGNYNYVEYYLKERPENLTFNYKYKKNSPLDLDEFLFVKTSVNIRKEPNANSKIIKKGTYNQKYKVVGKVKGTDSKTEWYEIDMYGQLAYIFADNKAVVKRTFDFADMMKKIEKTNNFINKSLQENKIIYVLDDYTPLGGGEGSSKDKFGNRENQSERGYTSSSFTEFINIPDRSIMTILEETDKYIKVEIDVYDGVYYLKKSTKKLLKNSNIKENVKRFIYVDRHSQNEIIVEKNESENNWNVVTSSFVTTGKDSGSSYATPYGTFLIAYSKPVMQYTGSDNKTVVGDAKNAVRFSGGGYMHSIPSLFEPKSNREARKAATARKIGTYAESHKCIRHYDDQIKFIYDWLGNATPGHKFGYRVPTTPTLMLVK